MRRSMTDEDDLIDFVMNHEDSSTLHGELERFARDSHRSFLTRADQVNQARAAEAEQRKRSRGIGPGGGAVAGEHPYRGKNGRVDWDKVAEATWMGDVDEPT